MKLGEIVAATRQLRRDLSTARSKTIKISVLSNITVNQLEPFLEYSLLKEGVVPDIEFCPYDTIVQSSSSLQGSVTIIFWELCNLIEGLHYKAGLFSFDELESLIIKTKSEITYSLNNLASQSLVLINTFSSYSFSPPGYENSNYEKICHELNHHLLSLDYPNLRIIDLDKILCHCGDAFNYRFFYLNKSLYSPDFYEQWISEILPDVLPIIGRTRKALILDCDNTLWKGIVGEDGVDGISITPQHQEIQSLANELSYRGIIIGICSKNNPEDVEEVFQKRSDICLLPENITIQKISWKDKVTGLSEIAHELNIGLDSIVFIDDSEYEINLVKQGIPEVVTWLVPDDLSRYPLEFRRLLRYFSLKSGISEEDRQRNVMYREEHERKLAEEQYSNMDEYLNSLGLEMTIFLNPADQIQRISQLTQKTNQFNLTTRRYTEQDVGLFLQDDTWRVYSFSLQDRFGKYGITGLCIVHLLNQDSAIIDTYLMSCRVLGREAEYAFIRHIMRDLQTSGIRHVLSEYRETRKNRIVSSFFVDLGFSITYHDEKTTKYAIDLSHNEKSIKRGNCVHVHEWDNFSVRVPRC